MKKFLLPLLLLAIPQILFSQMSKKEQSEELRKNAKEIRWQEHVGTPSFINFSDNYSITHEQAIEYSKSFCAAENVGFTLRDQQQSKDGKMVYKYTQTIAGYPIEFSAWHVHEKNGRVTVLNGDIVNIQYFNPVFLLSEEEALQAALNYIGAELYMWMNEGEEQNLKLMLEDDEATYYPTGVKIITPVQPDIRKNKLTTAYKFNIYSIQPFDRKMVYVDAQTGEILFDLPLIHFEDVVGTAHTAYYGIRQINTFKNSPTQYILHDNTRGNGIKTYNMQKGTYYGSAVNFFDDDNIWNNVNANLDQYATDAHFGAISTYDYYWNIHNRNSINGNGFNLLSYVHYNYNYQNAFWDGQRMTYGDGSGSVTPLTAIDVCGHEITHGLTEFTASLVYAYEPGALNEAFSDIFGTCIEFYAVPEDANWVIGEKMNWIIRSMLNPKAYGQPDTYHGINWYFGSNDNGGVHTNSGVLNYWFYLLCEGGSGTNDLGNAYQVQGIGMENAEQLAFKILTEYLSPGSQYIDACNWGIFAASELFGGCTPEVQSVGDAFYAVGVLTSPFEGGVSVDFKAAESMYCSIPATVAFSNKTFNGISYLWDFGDGTTSTETNPVHTYTEEGNYTVTLTAEGGDCGSGVMVKEDYIKIDESYICNLIMPPGNGNMSIEGCAGVFYDPGGPNGNYPPNCNSTLTIHAPEATSIVLTIEELDIEPGSGSTCNYDYIRFYNGSSTGAPLINNTSYCNTTGNPGTITATGEYITILFHSDIYVEYSGFKIFFQCYGAPATPKAKFSVNTQTTCTGLIEFTDQSTGTPTEWLWDFGDGNTSNIQHPVHHYIEPGTYTVSLTVTNEFGTDNLQKANWITFEIPEAPEIDDITGCNDQEFEIALNWEGTAYWYANSTDDEPVYIGNVWMHPPVTENKTYFVREITENFEYCVSSFTEALIIPVVCIPPPPPVADFSVNTQLTCTGLIEFTDESTGTPTEWLWDFGDGNTSDVQDPVHQYTEYGDYTVSLMVANEFGTDTIQKIDFITFKLCESISQNQLDNITISPNPTTGALTITNCELRITDIEVFDVYGKKLSQISPELNSGLNSPFSIQIDISHLASGIYFLHIQTENGTVTKKIVKE